MEEYEFLNDLNENQREVCISTHNYILTACPGSGKTRTITYRLAYLSEKYSTSKLLNIAITYTNRAANEIENRLLDMDIDTHNVWSGTIHQFCMRFIIRPYAMYHSKLCKGYTIIDEYIKEKYVSDIAKKLGLSGYVKKHYKNPSVMEIYYNLLDENKEIDFDKILEYSLELVEDKSFIASNISGLVRSIHVDEYQDTNEKQYQILSRIVKENTQINILFVGDVNQAIYRGLGGVAKTPKEIKDLFPVVFEERCLDGCYRSTQRVVEYYVNYEVESTGVISVSDIKDESSIICYDYDVHKNSLVESISQIVKNELENGVSEEEICIVAPKWDQIYTLANELREKLPECSFDAPNVTPIKYDPLNIFYLIAKLLFTKNSNHRYLRRKLAHEIIVMTREDYDLNVNEHIGKFEILKAINSTPINGDDGILILRNAIERVFEVMGVEFNDDLEIVHGNFFDKIDDRIKRNELDSTFDAMVKSFKEKTGIVINTIHGVKGEEYSTVVGFDLLNGHLPHWDYMYDDEMKPLRNEDTNKLLYVLCSRAKKNIYLFSENGRVTKKGNPLSPTDELYQYSFNYD